MTSSYGFPLIAVVAGFAGISAFTRLDLEDIRLERPSAELALSMSQQQAEARELPAEVGFSDPNCGLNGPKGIEFEILERLNAFRAEPRMCGDRKFDAAGPIRWNRMLLQAAFGHSADMARTNLVSHKSLDARENRNRVIQAGYTLMSAGENIAVGQESVEQAIAAWIKSPPHCATMMNPDFEEVGVACVYKRDSFFRFYWTMNLAKPLKRSYPQQGRETHDPNQLKWPNDQK